MYLLLLILGTTVLLLLAVAFVRMRGWEIDIKPFEEEDLGIMGQMVPKPIQPEPEEGITLRDLSEGDTIYVETLTGTKYYLMLVCKEDAIYHLKRIEHRGKSRTTTMQVVMRARIAQDRPLIFWSMDSRRWVTTPVKRLLVA